jgi:phosphatidylcholine synthase
VTDRTRLWLAWGVHLFTASGAVVGVLALLAVHAGDLRAAALWMLLAMAIDSLDGSMARAVGVSRVLPHFDGRRLDDIVDYLNYAIVPCVFLVAGGLLPHWWAAAPPILASAYGFSQVEAKTEDDFFLGFPSYWNVIAIQAWLLEVPPAPLAAIVAGFALLVFVPLKYVYPSKMRAFKRTTYGLTAASAAAVAWCALEPERARELRVPELTLLYPAWYFGVSLWLGGFARRRG